jgi:hypothetical protein
MKLIILIAFLISRNAWSNDVSTITNGVITLGVSTNVCKTVSRPAGDGCNTCEVTICHDDKIQWAEPVRTCTLLFCNPKMNVQPYDSKAWK